MYALPAPHVSLLEFISYGMIGIGLLTLAVIGVGAGILAARRRKPGDTWANGASPADGEDEARRLRILADDREHGFAAWMAPLPAHPELRAPRERAEDLAPFDARTAGFAAAEPAPAEPADVAEHVAPGAGSVVSIAETAIDTKLRDSVGLTLLHAAEEQAYAEIEEHEVAALFADFDRAVGAGLEHLERAQWSAGAWSFYQHDAEGAHCPHCAEAVEKVSGEFRELTARVLSEHTQQFSRADLMAVLAS